jgi:type II secretory pathway component PulF
MRGSTSFTALDWMAVALVALAAIVLAGFPFTVAPSFARMYADFGGPLPAVTRVIMTPWAAPSLGLVAAMPAVIAVALSGSAPAHVRRGMVLASFLLAGVAIGAVIYALYAPIFDLAGKIKAD